MRSFNVVRYYPPLVSVPEHWSDFPVTACIVNRGGLKDKTADFGAMELYACSVVASDLLRVGVKLKSHFNQREA